jgi:serine protease Do
VRELNIKGEAKARQLEKGRIEIAGALDENDKTDLDKLSKVHTVELKAGQGYVIDVDADNFDPQVYMFDGKSKLLGQDPAKAICVATANGPHHLVVKSFDGQTGNFTVKIREFTLKGEAKARDLGKDGLTIKEAIGNNDITPLDKLGKIYSVNLKGGQTYTIDLEGQNLDFFLYLFDAKGAVLAQDDDSVAPASRITFEAPRDGVYNILATTVEGKETGDFTLTVRKKEKE